MYDIIIIGGGPAGMIAALYSLRNNNRVLIIEKESFGGQIATSPRVENYPTIKEISGLELSDKMFEQIADLGVEFELDEVLEIHKDKTFKVKSIYNEYEAKTVVIASGTTEKKIGLEKEDEMLGHGLSYCALCDGHFFKGQDIIVIGGGNSALKEAIHLTHVAKKVYLIHRRNEFRGSAKLVEELRNSPNVEILTPYVPHKILADDKVYGIEIEHRETGEIKTIELQGIFPAVGQNPNTQYINIEGVLDDWKTVPVTMKTMETSCENLFAGGDVLPRDIRQIYLAEHDGIVIAKTILERLGKN